MDSYVWLIILGAWALLLLLGLAGGDPLAAGQPGREAPAIAFAKWLHRLYHTWTAAQATSALRPSPHPIPSRRPTESGLHAVV